MTDIINSVLQHRNSLYTYTKSKSRTFFRIVTGHFQNIRMYHPGSQNFDPSSPFTHTAALTVAYMAADIYLYTRFGKLKIAWTKTDFTSFTEHFFRHEFQRSLQIGHRDMLSDDESLYLRKLMRMRRIIIIPAIHFPRAYDLDRQLRCICFQLPCLDRRRMRSL